MPVFFADFVRQRSQVFFTIETQTYVCVCVCTGCLDGFQNVKVHEKPVGTFLSCPSHRHVRVLLIH